MDNFCGIAIKTDIYNGVTIDLSPSDTADEKGTLLSTDVFESTLKGILNLL